ncbi:MULTISPECIES: glycosyltransferase family 2 protein [unclassified Gemella]|uniref:glycosyltransferase PgfS n=1 Tax=unclassified Gemella TaxID=2624949 RepID=UPI0010731368|nr:MULTISPECIES: glycosyltransferase family 2 protein [unclassified Gemella]MBF0710505.1 glycosyltransferase family 2 protein [Gemella sp. GL1.1]MBF0746553.1 glycosyltransferase family 2 protein [Gemella sp. 19428wG2_WT2a]NYS27849.1 glycosyltransferase family 2 protein [Gemella sp. GL1]TFU59914.1 glycosyltransferase [Gemella sp. WT2a]
MKLSIVVAFFNEEKMIEKTHREINKYVSEIKEISDYELVFVNDGSKDRTLELMKNIAKENPKVKYISFSRNFGREGALLAGLRKADGEMVMIMDGDLQHPPQLIHKFVEGYLEGYDVVSGRRNREGESKLGTLFANLFYKTSSSLMDVKLTNGISEFKLFSRKAVDAVLSLEEYNRFSKGIFSWIGFKEKIIDYQNQVREAGESKFGFRRSLNYAMQGIMSFNEKPLRIVLKLGFICVFVAVLYLLSMIALYFTKPHLLVSGYFTTIAMITFLGGVQLISIGILGEYIGKIFYEVKRRPHYLIDETNFDEEDSNVK